MKLSSTDTFICGLRLWLNTGCFDPKKAHHSKHYNNTLAVACL